MKFLTNREYLIMNYEFTGMINKNNNNTLILMLKYNF